MIFFQRGVFLMFCKDLFEEKVKNQNKTMAEVARHLGINRSTLYRKISQSVDFTRNEMAILFEYLNLTVDDFMEIFIRKKSLKAKKEKGVVNEKRNSFPSASIYKKKANAQHDINRISD